MCKPSTSIPLLKMGKKWQVKRHSLHVRINFTLCILREQFLRTFLALCIAHQSYYKHKKNISSRKEKALSIARCSKEP